MLQTATRSLGQPMRYQVELNTAASRPEKEPRGIALSVDQPVTELSGNGWALRGRSLLSLQIGQLSSDGLNAPDLLRHTKGPGGCQSFEVSA